MPTRRRACRLSSNETQDANPFERQGSDRSMTGLALGTLLLVILLGPWRVSDRVERPFMKGLAQERGTGPAPVNPALLSTGGDHRRNPAITLNLVGRLISLALTTERRDQPRRQHGSSSRK